MVGGLCPTCSNVQITRRFAGIHLVDPSVVSSLTSLKIAMANKLCVMINENHTPNLCKHLEISDLFNWRGGIVGVIDRTNLYT